MEQHLVPFIMIIIMMATVMSVHILSWTRRIESLVGKALIIAVAVPMVGYTISCGVTVIIRIVWPIR